MKMALRIYNKMAFKNFLNSEYFALGLKWGKNLDDCLIE